MYRNQIKKKFGQYLLEHGLLNTVQLEEALYIAKLRGIKLGRTVVELGHSTQEAMNNLLKNYLVPKIQPRVDEVLVQHKRISIEASELQYLLKSRLVPIEGKSGNSGIICDQFDDIIFANLEKQLGSNFEITIVSIAKLNLILSKLSDQQSLNQNNNYLFGNSNKLDRYFVQDPYQKLLDDCLREAIKRSASDIHFEAFPDYFLIRFRIHGQLNDWKILEKIHSEPLTSRLKDISGMDLAVSNKPQDGRASLKELGVDIRANSMPVSCGGEKFVFRLIYQESSPSINQLGLSERAVNEFRFALKQKNGLILLSGPTGSGKTTTLYAFLNEMDRYGKNISTVENPVEKSLPRINQVNINLDAEFDEIQKALMRQDPDVVLLGEIRDEVSAKMAFKLAATGHLVLSTIHANGAIEVMDRLNHLGIDYHTIKDNLRLSVAQRLYPLLCYQCSIPPPDLVLAKFNLNVHDKLRQKNPSGCSSCESGIKGRIALVEYINSNDIGSNAKQNIQPKTTLENALMAKIYEGKIDVSEAIFLA